MSNNPFDMRIQQASGNRSASAGPSGRAAEMTGAQLAAVRRVERGRRPEPGDLGLIRTVVHGGSREDSARARQALDRAAADRDRRRRDDRED